MVQRSAPQSYYAERYFPVRVRVAVPPGGFGRQLDEIYAWLDQRSGPAPIGSAPRRARAALTPRSSISWKRRAPPPLSIASHAGWWSAASRRFRERGGDARVDRRNQIDVGRVAG
jgi:hypothetical protein